MAVFFGGQEAGPATSEVRPSEFNTRSQVTIESHVTLPQASRLNAFSLLFLLFLFFIREGAHIFFLLVMNGAQPVSPLTSDSTSQSPTSINLASSTLISIAESTNSNPLVQDLSTPTTLPSADASEISLSEDLLASSSEDKDLGSHDDTVATADPDDSGSMKQEEAPIVVQLEEATLDEATATGANISEDLLADGDHELKRVKVCPNFRAYGSIFTSDIIVDFALS